MQAWYLYQVAADGVTAFSLTFGDTEQSEEK